MFWSVRRLLHTLALDAPVPSAGLQKEGGGVVLVQAYENLPNLKIIANQARMLLILGKSLLYRWFVHLVFVSKKALIAVTVMAIIVVNKGLSSQCRLFVVCCPHLYQVRREATASLLIIHTRTRYQPSCGEQIEITQDTFCNTFYFNTWGLGTTIKHSRWKKTVFCAGVCGTFSRSSTLHK